MRRIVEDRGFRLCFLGLLFLGGCAGWPYLPWAKPPLHSQAPPGVWHVVVEGETVEALSSRTGVPAEDFREINGLSNRQQPKAGQIVFMLFPDLKRNQESIAVTPAPRKSTSSVSPTEHRPEPKDEGRLAWPVARPMVSSFFGTRWGRNHEGIDFAAPLGTAIFAADDGVVIYADNILSGYGNMVIIEHAGGLLTAYAHASVIMVQRGESVRRAQPIARVGQSGRATAPHLHFEVRHSDSPRDPMQYLPPLPGK